MAKYKIVGLPKASEGMDVAKSLAPVARDKANLEAEKGETVLTKKNDTDNILEFYKIDGKPHSQGGTPLNLPAGEKPGEGSSFIYSKKLKESSPISLEFFGMDPKKKSSFSTISEKWLEVVNKSKAILKDDTSDKIAKTSATKNLDTASIKLAALALKQEASKGMPDGIAKVMQPFLDKLQVSPDMLFSVAAEQEQSAQEQVMELGGSLKKFVGGGTLSAAELQLIKSYKYGQPITPEYKIIVDKLKQIKDINTYLPLTGTALKDINGASDQELIALFSDSENAKKFDIAQLNGTVAPTNLQTKKQHNELYWGTDPVKSVQYEKQFNYLNNIGDNDKVKDALYEEYKATLKDPKYVSKGYQGKLKELTKDEVFNNFKQMQLRNMTLNAHGIDYTKLPGNSADPAAQHQAINDLLVSYGINDDNIKVKSADQVAQEQASWIAFNRILAKKDYYNDESIAKTLKPFAAPTKGNNDEIFAGLSGQRISMSDGTYGDTTSRQLAEYTPEPEAPKTDKDKKIQGTLAEFNPTVDTTPFGYREQDMSGLARALEAKTKIHKYRPFAVTPQVNLMDAAYYSPDADVNAINAQTNQAITNANTFGNPQAAAANAMAINAQAYAQTSQAIGSAADKNVGVFNNISNQNTQLENSRNQQLAATQNNLYDKNTLMNQQYDNAISLAKDKILQMKNASLTNAQNLYNLNTTNEYYKTNPFTGLVENMKPNTPITPTTAAQTAIEEYQAFAKGVQGIHPDAGPKEIMNMYTAYKSGKATPSITDESTRIK